MTLWDTSGFWWFIAMVCSVQAGWGIYRVRTHSYVPQENKHEFSIFGPTPLCVMGAVNVDLRDSEKK